ncbi:OmpA family protein [Gangjinia marincola]|uniref:OmpA family protein n=1 Tax=Gangjinia marincola TaxID=578463 RepID=A0ABP3XX53_9FLAO
MKRIMLLSATAAILLTGCVSNKKYAELEAEQQRTQDLLNTATVKLNACLADEAAARARLSALKEEVANLRKSNNDLISTQGNLTTLSAKGAENLEKSLESLKEKDLQITRLQDALTRKDSVTLALVTNLKRSLSDQNDEDIEVNVEKGVVFVSISDKLLFKSGSYTIQPRAKEVIGKVAKIVIDKKDVEFMVEGHTDNVPITNNCVRDNWDLSVLRATSIVRLLQDEFDVDPGRMTAAGRSEFVPLASNDTAADRAKNRRTRIVVLPKLDQFYEMIEEGMEEAKQKSGEGGN